MGDEGLEVVWVGEEELQCDDGAGTCAEDCCGLGGAQVLDEEARVVGVDGEALGVVLRKRAGEVAAAEAAAVVDGDGVVR